MKRIMALLLLAGCASGSSMERLVTRTEPKVVKIGMVFKKGHGTCSGAIIDEKGTVLTCAHCVMGEQDVEKLFIKDSNGRVYKATGVDVDPEVDLALLTFEGRGRKFDHFTIGDMPRIGQQVVSFGSPLGMQHTFTVGWVDNIFKKKHLYVMHSAFVNPGNSGGPLVDLHGRLIGINEATIGYGFFQEAQGMFIAISLPTIREFLDTRINP